MTELFMGDLVCFKSRAAAVWVLVVDGSTYFPPRKGSV
jgi:hypothetical protein